jgi:hypothetical protein
MAIMGVEKCIESLFPSQYDIEKEEFNLEEFCSIGWICLQVS